MTRNNDITDTRLRVLNNGFTPLANLDKRCFIPDWPTIEVDEDAIRQWDRISGWTATGLRLENGLTVIDFDIDIPAIIEMYDALIVQFPELSDALMRRGGGDKQAWFVRTPEPFNRITGPLYVSAEDLEKGHRIEVFGGGSPRQFGAFGWHTEGKRLYSWVDEDPTTTPLKNLPEISKKKVSEIIDFCTAWLNNRPELVRHSEQKDGECNPERVYDLTEEMVFQTMQAGEMTLEQLRQHGGGLNCAADVFDGEIAQNTRRCLVSIDHSGGVAIHDTMTGTTHHEEALRPVDVVADGILEEAGTILNRFREESSQTLGHDGGIVMDARSRAGVLLENYAFMPSTGSGGAAVLLDNCVPDTGMYSISSFRNLNAAYATRMDREIAPRNTNGGVVNPVDFWLSDLQLQHISGVSYRPDQPFPLYREHGALYKNLFLMPAHSDSSGTLDVFHDYFREFIPKTKEREWLLDHIAYKFRNPEQAQVGVVFVSPEGGTGRGTLLDILQKLFSERNVRSLPESMIMKKSSQSSFSGNFMSSVILFCEEITSSEDMTQTQQHHAYNNLKELVDPRPRTMTLPVKYGADRVIYVCPSFFLATNNSDAIPIPREDRRFVVLQNGRQRSWDFWKRLRAWMEHPHNIGALAAWLRNRDLSSYRPQEILMTSARSKMILETRYSSEEAVSNVMDDITIELGGRPWVLAFEAIVEQARELDNSLKGTRGSRRVRKVLEQMGYESPRHAGRKDDKRERMRLRVAGPLGESQRVQPMVLASKSYTYEEDDISRATLKRDLATFIKLMCPIPNLLDEDKVRLRE